MERVMADRKKSAAGIAYTRQKFLCTSCCSFFVTRQALLRHQEWCYAPRGQVCVRPEEGAALEFQPTHRQFQAGYCFFLDFEALQLPVDKKCSCKPEKMHRCRHKSDILNEHVAFAYAFIMVDREGKVVEDFRYMGEDAADHCLELLLKMDRKYTRKLFSVKKMTLTEEEQEAYIAARTCYVCSKPVADAERVRHHDHLR